MNVNYFTHHMYFLFLTQIDKKAMKTSGMVARVRNEVEIHCQLKHPAILEVINKCNKVHVSKNFVSNKCVPKPKFWATYDVQCTWVPMGLN